ncbi:MAG: acyl-CoA/acyl-ACP dehydrogenase [Chloroflexi bacterium]|nr:acyl-CoA/acyl-ACP dehydrogenase [Chloroflexota bacterium]
MDFDLSEEQKLLKTTANDFLSKEYPSSMAKKLVNDQTGPGYYPELWSKIADMGWQGLAFPEKYGGIGSGFLDLTILLEEMGFASFLSPFASTVVSGIAILENGTEKQKEAHLPKLTGGKLFLSPALLEPKVKYDQSGVTLKATPSDTGYTLSGAKLFVPYGHLADCFLVSARTPEGITVFLVDAKSPGVKQTPLKNVAADRQSEVKLDKVKVSNKDILGKPGEGWPIVEKLMQMLTAARCAELVGGSRKVLDLSLAYVKQRHQFGRPVGSFQAVQHHCVNMTIEADGMRMITYQAAWMLGEGIPCAKEVSMAKAWASTVYPKIAMLGHQVHGAIAYTQDYDMYLYYLQSAAGDVYMGDADTHLEKVAQEILK